MTDPGKNNVYLARMMSIITRFEQIARYYGVGIVNSIFGFTLYAIFVYFIHNRFIAQICSHVIGTAFNYFMFRRHVFRSHDSRIVNYIMAYAFNYLLGLSTLWLVSLAISSPYIAGLISLIFTAFVNYFVLRRFVFRHRDDGTPGVAR